MTAQLALLFLMLGKPGASPYPYLVGPWQITVDDARATVRLADAVALTGNYVTFYQPGWKAVRLSTAGAAPDMKGTGGRATLTWTKSVAGAGRADMKLVATSESLEFSARLRTEAPGPVEMGFFIPQESLWGNGRAIFETSDRGGRDLRHIEVGAIPFEQQQGIRTFSCEVGGHILDISLTASRGEWVLQDFRASREKAVRLVMSAAAGDGPAEVTASATIRARKIGGDVAPLPRAKNVLTENPGFEDGGAGWDCPSNAAPDDEFAIEGKRSMRMTVTARGQPVYVTRMVPVVEGRRYGASAIIKSDDVRPLPPGPGYGSTGATIIVEWADKKRKWLAAGSYGAGVYGTSDWREVALRQLNPAPPGAGYAIIFLSLRAIGTAWFDDVRFYEIPLRPLELIAPADGARIADNRPLFTWERAPVPGYVLQLSTNNAFMPPIIEAHAQGTSWRPPEPIEKGQWFWRVARSTSSTFAKTRSFTQTAEPTSDTAGPTLSVVSQSLSARDEALRIKVHDPSGANAKSVRAWVDGSAVGRARLSVSDESIEVRPADEWRPGLHWLRLRVADGEGNLTEDECPFVCGKAPTRYSFRRDGVLLEDGRPVFPFGIYQIDEEDMANAKRIGFDWIHNYRFESSQDDAAARKYLDAAREHGLKVFMGFDRGKSSGNGLIQGNMRMLCERVGALMDHPALAAWYLYDEPEHGTQYVSPAQLREYYGTLRALDPYHPACVVVGLPDPSQYRGAFDWFWSEEYSSPAAVAKMMRSRSKALPRVPICAIVHCYDRAQTSALRAGDKPSPSAFHPTPTELRANAYTAITQGSNGLLYWWYGDGGARYYALGEVPAAQEALKAILSEIRSLEPYLVADVPVRRPDHEPADAPLYLWAKKREGKALVIAVNPSDEPLDAKIDLHKFGATKATVLFENRRALITDGVLSDRFDALAVHVYELAI